MAQLMKKLVESEGFCCVFGYFLHHRDKTTKELSDHLGVSDRAVRTWKARIRERECKCQCTPACRYGTSSSSTSGTG